MINKLKTLIVDDEAIARQIIESYCSHLSDIEIIGQADNAFKAKTLIEEKSPELVFLDINMPVLDGMAFLRTLKNPPQIIFTTAYKEFAHEAFDLDAADYLLKPFSLERFLMAFDKVKERLKPNKLPFLKQADNDPEKFTFIKFDGKIHKIDFETLLYAEAQGNNVKIVCTDFSISPSISLTAFEEILPKTIFTRIHRSFMVNKTKIKQIEGNRLFVGESEIPIGANYREGFLKDLGI